MSTEDDEYLAPRTFTSRQPWPLLKAPVQPPKADSGNVFGLFLFFVFWSQDGEQWWHLESLHASVWVASAFLEVISWWVECLGSVFVDGKVENLRDVTGWSMHRKTACFIGRLMINQLINQLLTGAKRREFSGKIHWLTIKQIIPATPSNPSSNPT